MNKKLRNVVICIVNGCYALFNLPINSFACRTHTPTHTRNTHLRNHTLTIYSHSPHTASHTHNILQPVVRLHVLQFSNCWSSCLTTIQFINLWVKYARGCACARRTCLYVWNEFVSLSIYNKGMNENNCSLYLVEYTQKWIFNTEATAKARSKCTV